MKAWTGPAAAAALMGTVVGANYLTTTAGFITVGPGLTATAGTLLAGLALALRDGLQDAQGKAAVLAVVALAAGLSYLVAAPEIAIASAAAFAVSELIDFAVYTPMRERSTFGDRKWAAAVAVSSLVGALVDTVVFLWAAFGSAALTGPAIAGQLVGKGWGIAAFLAVGWAWVVVRGPVLREPVK